MPRKLLVSAVVLAAAIPLFALNGCNPSSPACETPDGSTPEPEADAGTPTPDAGMASATADTDLAAVRFNADGTVDTTFGTNGIARIDVSTGAGTARDSLWGGARDGQNRILLFGSARGANRNDTDRVVVRLSANGAMDEGFATKGVHTLNIGGLNDNARHGFVQPDGKIVTSGYTSQPTFVGSQSANRIVLLRLNDNGTPDNTFGNQGVVNSNPFTPADPINTLWGNAESYGVALVNGKYVTAGYGRAASSGTVNMVSVRYSETGVIDPTFATQGALEFDIAGADDRGRHVVALPNNRTLIVGSGTATAGNVDAMAMVLDADGKLDTTFDTDGYALYDFGRPDEAFFGAAVNEAGTLAAAVGYRTGTVGGVQEDDDAVLLLLPLDGSGPARALEIPLSESANDRLFHVAFGTDGKIYGAGFVAEGADTRMAVIRLNADGTRDTSFASGGVATVNVVEAKADETGRAVIVQSDGKVVVAGHVERP